MTATDAGLKAWRSLQCRLLSAGYHAELIERDDGRPELVVSRWALVKAFSDLAAAERWTATVAGRFADSQQASAGVRPPYQGDPHDRSPNPPAS